MTYLDVIKILSLIAIVVSVLLVLFLLSVKNRRQRSNLLFGSFILLNAIDISAWLTNDYLLQVPDILMLRITSGLLINPLFYLYILALCYSDFKWRPRLLWHALPFIVANLLLLPRFYLGDATAKMAFLEHFRAQPENQFQLWVGRIQFWVYLIAVYAVLFRYKRIYKENYAQTDTQTYRWAFQLTIFITVVHSIIVIKEWLPHTRFRGFQEAILVLVALNAVIIVCWFILKTMFHPELFRRVDSHLLPVKELVEEPPASPIGAGQEEQVTRLRAYMTEKEPYLDPDLTIQQLADQLAMPARDLSILINHHLGQRFFDFINEYRIRKAMELLRRHSNAEMNVQQIMFEVGFNSKSSFHTAFKKLSDLTPSQYRKQPDPEK